MRYLLLLFMFATTAAKAHTNDFPSPFRFESIDTVIGGKEELFVRANEWVAKVFVNAKEVIQMNDKEAGKIVAKGAILTHISNVFATIPIYVHYTLSIDTKDGKYRYSFSDFIAEEWISPKGTYEINASLNQTEHPQYLTNKQWADLKSQVFDQVYDLEGSLKTAMLTKTSSW